MPIFEYRCRACSHLEELLQKHGDPAPERCPACKKKGTMGKELSLTSFQLKGGGWYKDLYASAKPDSSTSADSSSSDSSSSSSTSTSSSSVKSETKADPKSDSKADSASKSESKPAPKSDVKSKSAPKRTSSKGKGGASASA